MRKLNKLLAYVSEHNEFYKGIIQRNNICEPTDITKYPILTRKQLQNNRYNMFSDGYKTKYYNYQLHRQYSSGTSGIPVNVYWDYKDWYASNISLWRKRLQWYGVHSNDKYVIFTLDAFNLKADGKTVYHINSPSNILSINVSLIQNDIEYINIVDIIDEFSPKWLYIQPFILGKLIQTYKQTGKKPPKSLIYIETVGEILSFDLRQNAIEFFNVPLANMYGSEEMNGIAYECPYHHMHIMDENVLVEIKNDMGIFNTGEGEAIVTNKNNFGMPLVRYNQGDQIIINNNPRICSCGYNSPFIEKIKGRTYESIILPNGTELNPFLLLEILSEINNRFDYIVTEYKFVYSVTQKTIYCLIKLRDECKKWFPNVNNELKRIFEYKILYNDIVKLNVIQVNEILWGNSKKHILEIGEI